MIGELPEWIYFNGKTYWLDEIDMGKDDPNFEGWWSYSYRENKDSLPPSVTDGGSYYYLVACGLSKEEAKKDLLERINSMKPWLIKL